MADLTLGMENEALNHSAIDGRTRRKDPPSRRMTVRSEQEGEAQGGDNAKRERA